MADEDGRWMTFAELAATRGTTKRAAVMLVRRHKWPRQQNNQGHVIALVPATWAEPDLKVDPKDQQVEGAGHSTPNGMAHAVAVLEQTLQALQEAHGRELSLLQTAVDQARAEVERLRQADPARRARGRWARLRAAWAGSDG